MRRQFNWKYIDNPFGDSLHLLTLYKGDIVAARGFWQLDPGEMVLQCVDTTVKSEHQGKGVFKMNIDYLFRMHPQLVFYNYPNSSSMKQYLKYGWRVTHDYPVKFNFSIILEKYAKNIEWGRRELEWRFARQEVNGRYFLSVGSANRIYLWGIRRRVYPVLLGEIGHMLDLPVKRPLVGFSYDNLPGFPIMTQVRYIATGLADKYASFYRFDMS